MVSVGNDMAEEQYETRANGMVAIPLLFLSAISGGALLFYGGSILLAAADRNAGCEVTAFSNAVLGRHDQVGRALFGAVDRPRAELYS
jgi:hypothetical protein